VWRSALERESFQAALMKFDAITYLLEDRLEARQNTGDRVATNSLAWAIRMVVEEPVAQARGRVATDCRPCGSAPGWLGAG